MDAHEARVRLDAEWRRLFENHRAIARDKTGLEADPAVDPTADGDLVEREIDESMLGMVDAELAELRAARLRLADGTYGRCVACGVEIPDERLRALPATPYCVDDERAAEILVDRHYVDDRRVPAGATEVAEVEALQHLELVEEDDVARPPREGAPESPEDAAVHVQR